MQLAQKSKWPAIKKEIMGNTKQGKLAWERNPIKVPTGVESSADDPLTMCKWKTQTQPAHFYHDQHNLPSAATKWVKICFLGC